MSLPRRWLNSVVHLFLILLLVGVGMTQAAPLVSAQSDSYNTPSTPLPTDDHTRAQSVLIDISSAIICQLVGIDPLDLKKGCVTLDPVTRSLTYNSPTGSTPQVGGLLGGASTMIGSMYSRPASTGQYVHYLADNFGIGSHTYAATGVGGGNGANATADNQGFSGLASLQSTWVITRNISYLLLTILFIVIGFAIMLRIHIDPRTVMSIQNQIPKIIIAVLLITFSYAIVGILIDSMWFMSYFIINTFATDQADSGNFKNDLILYEYRTGISYGASGDTNRIADVKSVEDDLFSNNKKGTVELARVSDASQATLKAVDDYETGCTGQDCINNLTKAKQSLCQTTAKTPVCAGTEKLSDIFLTLSAYTIYQMKAEKVPDDVIADYLYDDFVSYSTTGVSLASIVENYSDNHSLRNQMTIHLNSNPIVFLNGVLSWGGGITDSNGILGLSRSVSGSLGDVISRTIVATLGLSTQDCQGFSLKFWTWADCATNIIQGTFKYIALIATFMIVLCALLVALFKVWFNLLRAMVYIIIYTVLGPLMIVIGLFPGSPYGFSGWIRALLAHLMVFPVTIFFFVLARIMASNTASNNPHAGSFLPPLIVNTNTFDNFGLLIAFGIILITPEALNWVRAAFKAKPGPVGGVVAAGLGAGRSFSKNITGYPLGKLWRPYNASTGQSTGFLRRALVGVNDMGDQKSGIGFVRRRIVRPIVGSISPNKIGGMSGH